MRLPLNTKRRLKAAEVLRKRASKLTKGIEEFGRTGFRLNSDERDLLWDLYHQLREAAEDAEREAFGCR